MIRIPVEETSSLSFSCVGKGGKVAHYLVKRLRDVHILVYLGAVPILTPAFLDVYNEEWWEGVFYCTRDNSSIPWEVLQCGIPMQSLLWPGAWAARQFFLLPVLGPL